MKLRKRYTIEYIDNERDLDILNAGTHSAPWELFKKEIIEEKDAHDAYSGKESIDGKAWTSFMLWSLCPDKIYISNANNVTHPLFCQMWMELLDEEGNVVYEDLCELPSTVKHSIYSAINGQANKECNTLKATVVALEDEINNYKAFIKEYRAEKLFDYFRRENAE